MSVFSFTSAQAAVARARSLSVGSFMMVRREVAMSRRREGEASVGQNKSAARRMMDGSHRSCVRWDRSMEEGIVVGAWLRR